MMLLRLKPGVDPRAFALDVRRALFPAGGEAVTTRDLLDQGGVSLRNFASEVEALMIAALAVGVLSLGVQALRAVVERRRSVGLMRALGLQPHQLVAGVIIESLLAAAAGVVVGIVSGSAIGYFFMSRYYTGGAVSLQVDTLSLAVILTFVTAAAVTVGPALAAVRTAPAQALRLMG